MQRSAAVPEKKTLYTPTFNAAADEMVLRL
jgi:hypothetical protein